jgi:hyperosmotically inducible periplasmic protein
MYKKTFAATAVMLVALAAQLAGAQTSSSHREGTAMVSTAVHGRDKARPVDSDGSSLSGTQPESAKDADLADRVRRTVVADRNLSSYAAKINIVANDGNVQLSGLVQNEGEKAQIASKAAAIAGQRHVVNALKVMPNVADGTGLRELLRRASEPPAAVVAAN